MHRRPDRHFWAGGLLAAAALLGGCTAAEGEQPDGAATSPSASAPVESAAAPATDSTDSAGATGATGTADTAAAPFGTGCSSLPGDGQVPELTGEDVTDALADVPQLSRLDAAISAAGLEDSLDALPAVTVFAPDDGAWAALGDQAVALLADPQGLAARLGYHVVPQLVDPADPAGQYQTLAGDTITVEGSGADYTVAGVPISCGGIAVQNGYVYVVPEVLARP